jgi:hypothetical protein
MIRPPSLRARFRLGRLLAAGAVSKGTRRLGRLSTKRESTKTKKPAVFGRALYFNELREWRRRPQRRARQKKSAITFEGGKGLAWP